MVTSFLPLSGVSSQGSPGKSERRKQRCFRDRPEWRLLAYHAYCLQLNAEHSTPPVDVAGVEPALGPLVGTSLWADGRPGADVESAGSGCTYPDRHIGKKHYLLLVVYSFMLAGFEVRITSLLVRHVDDLPVIGSPLIRRYGGCCPRGSMYAGHKIFTSPLPQICGSPLDFPVGGLLAESFRALLSCRAKQGHTYLTRDRLCSRVILFISIKLKNVNNFCDNSLRRLCQQILLKLHHPLIIRRIPRDIWQVQSGDSPPDDIDQPGEFS